MVAALEHLEMRLRVGRVRPVDEEAGQVGGAHARQGGLIVDHDLPPQARSLREDVHDSPTRTRDPGVEVRTVWWVLVTHRVTR
jgi:hypothetical protein